MKILRWVLNKFTGVEITRNNFQKKRIPVAIVVFGLTLLLIIIGDMFSAIASLVKISKQPWYSVFIAQFSFVMISVKIIFLSLFTPLNNPFGRYKVALIYQFTGLVFGVVLNVILNDLVLPSQNINQELKTLYSLLPYLINIIIFVAMGRVYADKNFREDKYLGSKK